MSLAHLPNLSCVTRIVNCLLLLLRILIDLVVVVLLLVGILRPSSVKTRLNSLDGWRVGAKSELR